MEMIIAADNSEWNSPHAHIKSENYARVWCSKVLSRKKLSINYMAPFYILTNPASSHWSTFPAFYIWRPPGRKRCREYESSVPREHKPTYWSSYDKRITPTFIQTMCPANLFCDSNFSSEFLKTCKKFCLNSRTVGLLRQLVSLFIHVEFNFHIFLPFHLVQQAALVNIVILLLLHHLPWRNSPMRDRAALFPKFLDHTKWHTTVCRTSLDWWSARRTDLYVTTHTRSQETNIHAHDGIQTGNPRKRSAVDPRLRPLGQ
jgi:hypothetical protein